LAGPFRAEVEQSAASIAQLCEGKAAPIANLRIVNPELMAVIAERQGLLEIARQRLEPAKMPRPTFFIQT